MITDAQQRIVTVNEAFTKITWYSATEALGQTPHAAQRPPRCRFLPGHVDSNQPRRVYGRGEIENRTKSGTPFTE